MALISWSCDPASHPILFWWAFLFNAIVSAGIYYIAMATRLPKDRMRKLIADAEEESEKEPDEEQLAAAPGN
jgi:hypothetical protein